MDLDAEKLEQAVLEKGYTSDPANKNKSVWLSEEGARLSEGLCEKLFTVK